MDLSPFIRLPPELREQIYELILRAPGDFIVLCSSGKPQLAQPHGAQPLALAQTCRQTRRESLPVFFRVNRFILQTDHITTFHRGYGVRTSWLSTLRRWLELIGDTNRRQLRDIDIDIELWGLSRVCETGQTAELVWGSLVPALRMIEPRTRALLRCWVDYVDASQMPSAELMIPLRDSELAKKAITEFFARHGWWTPAAFADEDRRMKECLRLVPVIRQWQQEAGK